jgi:hypothetical protein
MRQARRAAVLSVRSRSACLVHLRAEHAVECEGLAGLLLRGLRAGPAGDEVIEHALGRQAGGRSAPSTRRWPRA